LEMTDVIVQNVLQTEEEVQKSVIDRLELALSDAREGRVHTLFLVTGEIVPEGVKFAARTVLDYDHLIEMMLFIRSYFTQAYGMDPTETPSDPKDCN
jgi:hypothetical protein